MIDLNDRIPADSVWTVQVVADINAGGQIAGQGHNEAGQDRALVLTPCVADLDLDHVVGASDLALLLSAWGPNPGHPADLNGDETVDALDLAALLGAWGAC